MSGSKSGQSDSEKSRTVKPVAGQKTETQKTEPAIKQKDEDKNRKPTNGNNKGNKGR